MSYSPSGLLGVEDHAILSPWSDGSIRRQLDTYAAAAASSGAWPLANLAIYVPITIVYPFLARQAFVISGTTSGNNVDVGIYNAALARVVSSGGFARVAGGVAYSNITDTLLPPGDYYLALAHNSTNNIYRNASAAGLWEACGVCEQTSAYTLPATATLTRTTRACLPAFGLTGVSVGP
jgi:hypothetical protein